MGRAEGFEGVAGRAGGVEGFEGGGVAGAMGGGVAGPGGVAPGRAVVEPVADTFPEVGAPRPMRRAPREALRCTGWAPATDGVFGGTGVVAGVAGVAGPLRLGPGAGEFAVADVSVGEAGVTGRLPGPVAAPEEPAAGSPGPGGGVLRPLGPAVALWTTAAVPEGALPAVLVAGVAAPVLTPVPVPMVRLPAWDVALVWDVVPAEPVALLAAGSAAVPPGGVAVLPLPLPLPLPRSVVGRRGLGVG